MKKLTFAPPSRRTRLSAFWACIAIFALLSAALSDSSVIRELGVTQTVKANSVYFNFTSGSLNFSVSPSTVNQITTNDDWSGVGSVEGYEGKNLTATHGIDPQTILNTEFTNNQLPNTPTNVAANKGNPSAFNAGGLAEFDTGTYLAIGFQGNVQANPYMVFYLNTTGRSSIQINYDVQDIDGGSNNSVSQLALQYRVGETGLFTNLPAGYIADATDGGVAGRITSKSVLLPAACENQPKVQIRMITTNAAAPDGTSTPDEWLGVNNVVISSSPGVTAAPVNVGGRVVDPYGRGIPRTYVTMYDGLGSVRTVMTNGFGYYSFTDVPAGATYTLMVSAKGRTFSPAVRTISVLDEVSGLDFVSDN
jgi:hypothetical protein